MSRKQARVWPHIPEALSHPVIDNHTHLPVHEGEIPRADGVKLSVEEQLRRARMVGVTRLVTCACELPDFAPMCALAEENEGVRVAVAIHPNEAALHAGVEEPSPDGLTPTRRDYHIPLDDALAEVERASAHPLVVAIGESGLDYFRTAERGRAAQQDSFRAHLEIARRRGLPLQIHDRDAHEDTLRILRESASRDQGIAFHCYSGDAQMARELASRGWYASFAGPLTYPANEHLREALRELPRELVLVETDAPYLTPVPWRGSPNASYVMVHTVRAIAELWDVDEEEAARQLTENTHRLYGQW